MNALKQLQQLDREARRKAHPTIPDFAMPVARYKDDTANALTRAIIRFLELKGHACWRQSSEGRYRPGESITDVLGRIREMKGQWLPGQNNGASDVACVIDGRFCAIEVKVGRDRQRPHQHSYQNRIQESGGLYFIARTFEDFYNWYTQTVEKYR